MVTATPEQDQGNVEGQANAVGQGTGEGQGQGHRRPSSSGPHGH
jgi:hypothetical protein